MRIVSYCVLLSFCFIWLCYAKGSNINNNLVKDCDKDDLECLEDYISSSIIPSTTLSFEHSSSTLAEYYPEASSDFHEAKVGKSNSKPDIEKIAIKEIVKEQEDDLIVSESTETRSGLSTVEASILGVCGVLVVAGIAAGIFVWKNSATSDPVQLNPSNGSFMVNSKAYAAAHDLYSSIDQEKSNGDDPSSTPTAYTAHKDSNDFSSVIGLRLPTKKPIISEKEMLKPEDALLMKQQKKKVIIPKNEFQRDHAYSTLCNSPGLQRGVMPSALDPTYDPLTLGPNLRRLENNRVQHIDTPIRIRFTDDSDEEDQEVIETLERRQRQIDMIQSLRPQAHRFFSTSEQNVDIPIVIDFGEEEEKEE